jgi:hypothetical protein
MYKNANEVAAALAQPYDGPTKEKDGFTYIPATECRCALDRIFGPLGWNVSKPIITADPKHSVYGAAVRITAYVTDDNGATHEVSQIGFGRSAFEPDDAVFTMTNLLQIDEVAAAVAGANAFIRACKKFGPALRTGPENGKYARLTTAQLVGRSRKLGRRPDEIEQEFLKEAGVDWTEMKFEDWFWHVYKYTFDNEYRADLHQHQANSKEAAAVPAIDDDLPF